MVGVPGKFKGCNTCKKRRIKCDNQKPECQKCLDNDRPCGGYERERVFIVASVEDKGRCSSHPKRASGVGINSNWGVRKKRSIQAARPQQTRVRIHDEFGSTSGVITDHLSNNIHCVAVQKQLVDFGFIHQLASLPLYTSSRSADPFTDSGFAMHGLVFSHNEPFRDVVDGIRIADGIGGSTETLNHSQSDPRDMHASFDAGMVAPSPPCFNTPSNSSTESSSTCLFVYDSSNSTRRPSAVEDATSLLGNTDFSAMNVTPESLMGGSSERVRAQGPRAFTDFPEHHFFSRLFRPNACFDAIADRRATFLSEQEWCTVPWENIAKSDMDLLFDIIVHVPSLAEQGARFDSMSQVIARRIGSKKVLHRCLALASKLEAWYVALQQRHGGIGYSVFASSPNSYHGDMQPLSSTQFRFLSTEYAFLHLYFWATKIVLYRLIQHVQEIASDPIPFPASSTPLISTPLHTVFMQQPQLQQSSIASQVDFFSESFVFDTKTLNAMNTSTTQQQRSFSGPNAFGISATQDGQASQHAFPLSNTVTASVNFLALPYDDGLMNLPYTHGSSSPLSAASPFSAFGSTGASFTTQSRSVTPSHSQSTLVSPTHSIPKYLNATTDFQLNHQTDYQFGDGLDDRPEHSVEYFSSPPLPEPPAALASKYTEPEVLNLARNICHALPFVLLTSSTSPTSAGQKLNFAGTQPLNPLLLGGGGLSATHMPLWSETSDMTMNNPTSGTNANVRDTMKRNETSNVSSLTGGFGPDAATWPLLMADEVFRRQGKTEENLWCARMNGWLEREALAFGERVGNVKWRGWRE